MKIIPKARTPVEHSWFNTLQGVFHFGVHGRMSTQTTECPRDGEKNGMERHIHNCRDGGSATLLLCSRKTMLADVIIHGLLDITPLTTHYHWRSPLGEPSDKVDILDINLKGMNPALKGLYIRVPHANQTIQERSLTSHTMSAKEFKQPTVP